ncbi:MULTISPECIES: tetratricopeptide repeat protein [Clostridium]|uniref:Tetratricopeptide repeat protein n=1 Tax=Clostridium lapidicellarium TaxID=3240931 RepID=A0ABV4E021_9CLOT|nr:tetratricopeptide repeat protein [uncultured Clostridium sp.]NLU06723.1 hypothetical protein [Clostridiales bacterium]
MAFKNRRGISTKLFGKIPLKIKIVIFCILCIFAVTLIVKTSYLNNKYKTASGNSHGSTAKSTVIKNNRSDKLESEYKIAQNFFSNKEYSKTIDKANEIISQDDKYYKAYNIKGIALCYSSNYEEGMKNIDEALKLNPDFGYARFNKALAYELYGKYDEALYWYDKDLEIEKYVWSYYGKASIYGRREDVSNTVKFLKMAVDISPDIKSIARDEKDFDPVKNSREFQEVIK